ncbi:hypothetical protein ACFL3N_02290 [Candidatus Omnitrophota bacterium]
MITLDIDWAPDFIIDEVAEMLISKSIKATFFITHRSAAIDRLRGCPELFELGIHPNFYTGSSHGKTEDEVMTAAKELVPDAISMRTHGLYQNSRFLKKAVTAFGIKVDVSLYLPDMPCIKPHMLDLGDAGGHRLLRVPFFWEDDIALLSKDPAWSVEARRLKRPGLKIFNFHPFHIALNSCDIKRYSDIKSGCDLPRLGPDRIERLINRGQGARTVFLQLIKRLSLENGGKRIKDIYEEGLSDEDQQDESALR